MTGALIDKKIVLTACVVASFLLASSMLILFYDSNTEDKELRLIGRVNTEGSGIYLKSGENPDDYIDFDPVTKTPIRHDGEIVYHPSGWGGKIFGTPGTTTIQQMQLQTIVQEHLHLKLKPYSAGETLQDDTVYYIPSITSASAFVSSVASIPQLVGGIIWEPQFSSLIEPGAGGIKMMLTSDFEPEHTCCVIGASHKYISGNPATTVRFLAAYLTTVDRMADAFANPHLHPEDYEKIVEIAKNQTGITSQSAIEAALANINYIYKDEGYVSGSAPLAELEQTIESLADEYYRLGGILRQSMSDLGFSNTHSFAQAFVDDGYLLQAMNFGPPSPTGYGNSSLTVAYISGDLHTSLALGFGSALGIFREYGISVDLSPAANGAGVVTSIQNGESEFGFMGAPPILITTVNSKLAGY